MGYFRAVVLLGMEILVWMTNDEYWARTAQCESLVMNTRNFHAQLYNCTEIKFPLNQTDQGIFIVFNFVVSFTFGSVNNPKALEDRNTSMEY